MKKTVGSKYEAVQELDIKEIAKLVRADIAAAQKDGDLTPDAKFSVKISRFSGGQSMTVEASYPYSVRVSDVREAEQRDAGFIYPWMPRHVVANKEACEAIMAAYNYDNCDAMSDYFDVNFYAHTREKGVDVEPPAEAPQAAFLAWAEVA